MVFEEPQAHIDAMMKTLNEAKASSGLGADDPAVIELERIIQSKIAELQSAELQASGAQAALLEPALTDPAGIAALAADAGIAASAAVDIPIATSDVASIPIAESLAAPGQAALDPATATSGADDAAPTSAANTPR